MDIFKRNNIRIIGNTSGKDMVLGHGFGTDQTTWKRIVSSFTNEYRIILYDLVGAGNSDIHAFSPDRYNQLQSYADDLIDVCKATEVNKPIFLGHSVSGMTGLLASNKYADFFESLILIGASPRYINDDPYIGGYTQEQLNGLYQLVETNYFGWVGGFAPYVMKNEDKPELAAEFTKTLSAIRPDIALSVIRTIFQSDYRKILSNIKLPIQLINSMDDPALPNEVAYYMKEQLKNCKLNFVSSSGHFPQMSAPEEVVNIINEFLKN